MAYAKEEINEIDVQSDLTNCTDAIEKLQAAISRSKIVLEKDQYDSMSFHLDILVERLIRVARIAKNCARPGSCQE